MKSAHLKGKGQRPHNTNKQIEGKGKAEQDPYFHYNMTILIGCSAEVTTRDGEVYEGIYVAFSSAMEILLEAAHLVKDTKDDASIEKHFDVLVIPSEKVLYMKCVNADLTYPTREFATDTAISSGRGGGLRDKELTPWEGSEDTPEGQGLGLDSGPGNANGWEAKDMFKKNEEKYGVVSSFNHDLSGYTTQVDKSDTEFKRMEEQANQIAREIEGGNASWERTQVENGDEEEAFSAVYRPGRNPAPNSTVNNNNNNNTSSVGNDKYIPPSRRQTNMQPSAPPPAQSHPPSNNNGPPHNTNNNSGPARKPIYNQNQNPRNYGAPPNPVYHQDRRSFDSRRAPPPNQYANSGHGELRRPPPGEDSGPRQQRMSNKVPLDRKDPVKLKEFGNSFRLQSDSSQLRRPPPQPQHPMAGNSSSGPTRNPSPPSANTSISSNKLKKEEPPASLPPLIPPVNATAEPANHPPPETSPAPSVTTVSSSSSAMSATASPNTPNIGNLSITSTPTSTGSLASSVASDNQSLSSATDSKSGDAESKKKFTFNPNAKEFNPTKFTRSPSTPPRPPSTPATAATPQQVMTTPQLHQYMPTMPMMSTIMYQPYQTAAALTPSSNSSASSGVTTPRHGGHGGRKAGGVGIPPRSEITPPMQMTTGPPLLAPATAIQAAPPQYFVSQAPYPVMRVVPQGVMPVYPNEGSGGAQMHPTMHYLPPNGANAPNNTGHQPNSNQPSNPSAASNVPPNGHGYGQAGGSHTGNHHMGYPVGVPVVYGFPQQHNVIQLPYVHSQGGTTVIPQSQ